jgi:pimeloyl-ACP methyl ester carboxylesterase
VDARRIGLIGHSEGGVVAPLVASRSDAVAFMVLLAAPAMDGRSLAMLQGERIARAAGASADQLALQQALNRRMFEVLAREPEESTARAAVRQILQDELGKLGVTSADTIGALEKQMEPQIRRGLSPWFRHFLVHDPLVALRAAKVPTLALYGSLDVQVPADANAPLMQEALAGSSALSEVRTLAGLNHLFQTARTGAMAEYGRIEETFAPAALEAIAAWLARVAVA